MTTRYKKRLASRMASHRLGYHRPGLKARYVPKKSLFRKFRRGHDRTSGFYGGGKYAGGSNMELKFFDLDLNDPVISAAGTVTDTINGIGQGTTEIDRIGRKCTIKSINWRFQISLPPGTAVSTTNDTVRVILFLDKQCNGATATVLGIIETADFQSFNNLANKSRFRTLMDRSYQLNASLSGNGTTVDSAEVVENDAFYLKCDIPLEFDNTTGAITEIRSNNLGVLLISEGGLATFGSKIKLRFSDL